MILSLLQLHLKWYALCFSCSDINYITYIYAYKIVKTCAHTVSGLKFTFTFLLQ